MSTFGTRLPYPCITFPYSKQLNLYRIRSLCFALTTNTFDHDIANYLNNSLQYIPKNLRSIKKILTNTKKINNLAHFQCAGEPWCHNNQHFSKDLKDMGKEFTAVGTINANYVPHPTRTSSVYPVLEKWAKFLLIYKHGLSNYNETLNKRFEDNYVNIYSKQSILITTTKKRMNELSNPFINSHILDENRFFTALEKCAERYATKTYRTAPPPLIELLITKFGLVVDRLATPFTVNNQFKFYCTQYGEDKIFRAYPESLNHTWEHNSFVYPDSRTTKIVYQTINAAVLSKSEFTVILIPKLEKYVWKHPRLN